MYYWFLQKELVLWPRHQKNVPKALSDELRKIISAVVYLRVSASPFLELSIQP